MTFLQVSQANNNNKSILKGVMGGWFQIGVSIVGMTIQTAVLIRVLPAADAGFWFVAFSFINYLLVFDFGFSPTLTRHIAFINGYYKGSSPHTPDDLPKSVAQSDSAEQAIADQVKTVDRIYKILTVIVLTVSLFLGPLIFPLILKKAFSGEYLVAWACFSVGTTLYLNAVVRFAVTNGLGVTEAERLARAGSQIVGISITILAVYWGYGIAGAAAGWLVQNLIFFLASILVVRNLYPWLRRLKGRATLKIAKEMLEPSLKWAGMCLGSMLILATGPIIISWKLGLGAVPLYAALTQLLFAFLSLTILPAKISEPFTAMAYSSGQKDKVEEILLRNVRYLMSLTTIFCTIIAVFGSEIVNFWLGPGRFAGYPTLWTLTIIIVLETHQVIHAITVMATGRIIYLPWALGAGILNLVLGFTLVGPLGVWGVALGTMLAQMLTNNWFAPWSCLRLLRISFRAYFGGLRPVIINFGLCLGVAVGLKFFATFLLFSQTVGLITCVLLVGLVGLLGFWLNVLDHEERTAVSGSIRLFTARIIG